MQRDRNDELTLSWLGTETHVHFYQFWLVYTAEAIKLKYALLSRQRKCHTCSELLIVKINVTSLRAKSMNHCILTMINPITTCSRQFL